jgi:hypothetical protein
MRLPRAMPTHTISYVLVLMEGNAQSKWECNTLMPAALGLLDFVDMAVFTYFNPIYQAPLAALNPPRHRL